MHRVSLLALLVLAAVIWSQPASADEKTPPKVEKTTLGEMPNASASGEIIFGGQPSPEDLKAAKQRGVKAVLNLREAAELEFDEAQVAKELGLKYHHVPFQGADKLTDDVFDKVRTVLKDKEARPLLIHCHAANRVAAVWLAHRVLDQKVDFDQALGEAKLIGLKTAAYADKAKSYIERRSGSAVGSRPIEAAPADVTGEWTGTWGAYEPQSKPAKDADKAGMQLDCVVVRKGDAWQATFEGECGRPYKYTITMDGRRAGGVVLFKGTTDLGEKDGGVYDWIGRAGDKDFIGFYTSAHHIGVFQLTRKK